MTGGFTEPKARACVGCGFCCLKAPCWVALRVHGDVRQCPSLFWSGERYRCRLMMDGAGAERIRQELYAGEGCCAGLNSWRRDVKERTPDNHGG